jgi:hypothetical protein
LAENVPNHEDNSLLTRLPADDESLEELVAAVNEVEPVDENSCELLVREEAGFVEGTDETL